MINTHTVLLMSVWPAAQGETFGLPADFPGLCMSSGKSGGVLDDGLLFFTISNVVLGPAPPNISTASVTVMILMHAPALSGLLFPSNGSSEGKKHAWNQHETFNVVIRTHFYLFFVAKVTIEGGLRKHFPVMYHNAIPCKIRREREARCRGRRKARTREREEERERRIAEGRTYQERQS